MAADLADQIIAQRRVLDLLGRVYPVMVETGKMTQRHADEHIAALRAVLATLEGMTDRPAPDGDLDHLIPAGMKCTVTNFPPHTAYVWNAASPSQFWEGKGATREAAITEAAAAARAALGQEAGDT